MKRGLIALLIIASVAGWTLAGWASFGNVPWEDDGETGNTEINEIRCKGALDLRQTIVQQGEWHRRTNPAGVKDYDRELGIARGEVTRYCN